MCSCTDNAPVEGHISDSRTPNGPLSCRAEIWSGEGTGGFINTGRFCSASVEPVDGGCEGQQWSLLLMLLIHLSSSSTTRGHRRQVLLFMLGPRGLFGSLVSSLTVMCKSFRQACEIHFFAIFFFLSGQCPLLLLCFASPLVFILDSGLDSGHRRFTPPRTVPG